MFDGNQTASGVYYGRISVKAGVGMAKASQTIKVVRRYVLSELSSDLAIKETTPNKKYWFCLCFETVLWFLANLRDSIASASWVSVVSIVCHSAGLATKDAKRWLQLFSYSKQHHFSFYSIQFRFSVVPGSKRIQGLVLFVFLSKSLYFIWGSSLDFSYIFNLLTRENA